MATLGLQAAPSSLLALYTNNHYKDLPSDRVTHSVKEVSMHELVFVDDDACDSLYFSTQTEFGFERVQLERSVYSGPKKRPGGSLGTPGPEHRHPAGPVGQAAPVGGPDGHCRMAGAAGLWRRRGGHSQAPDLAHQPE